MVESRRRKSIRNLIFAWVNQFAMLIMNLVVRMIFVQVLSKEYLGLSGLFGNIISMLSLAEMGIGTAIVYSLYEPLARDDRKKIKALMKFYQKVYIMVGSIIGVIGLALTPYLFAFIKDMHGIPNLNLIYILFIVNASVSYFFSYKSALVTADQKDYIIKIVKLISVMVMYIIQITVLLIIRNYLIFLFVQITFTILQNVAFSLIANKLYPYIVEPVREKIDQKTFRGIMKNTRALIFHKIGDVAVFSTDNLIISKFVGLGGVALYSNYTMIQQALLSMITQIFTSMAASVGNMGALEAKEKKYDVFQKIFFLNFWLYGLCGNGFLCMVQEFIKLCFGEQYVMSEQVLFIIIFNFYITGMRRTVLTFKESLGLFWQNRYMPILEALINLVCSLFLVSQFGIAGVLIGTSISTILMPLWIEPWVLMRYGFHTDCKLYFKKYALYGIVSAMTMILCWNLCGLVDLIKYGIIAKFIVKLIICAIVPNLLFTMIFWRCKEMQYFIEMLGRKK